jgi:methylated-DNA-[protein]-cysteine S-methyltransferase
MKKKSAQASSFNPQKAERVFETPFAAKVYAIVAKIPKGKTMTYGQVAKRAGKPGAARAVGTIMAHNYRPGIPCHRVVRADGRVGDYNRGGQARKTELLREEGFLK